MCGCGHDAHFLNESPVGGATTEKMADKGISILTRGGFPGSPGWTRAKAALRLTSNGLPKPAEDVPLRVPQGISGQNSSTLQL